MQKSFILFISLFISLFSLAQQALDSKSFIKEFEEIRLSELRSHQRMGAMNKEGSAGFTVASTNFNIHHIRFDWNIDPAIRYIRGNITYFYTITQNTNSITFDLSNVLTVDSILYKGTKLNFQQTSENGLLINFTSTLNAGTKDSLTIFYQGVPPDTGFGSFYQGPQIGSTPAIYTLSEPYGSRDWWPCKNNLLDKIDSIDITITCPAQYQSSTNGLMVSNTVNSGTRTAHFEHKHLIASYLIAVAVTDYEILNDTFQTKEGPVTYQNFFYRGNRVVFNRNKVYHSSALSTFIDLFGSYPYKDEKYGHTQWGWGGGMEHQTNTFIKQPSPNIAAHELAHQWFGDLITCGSWQDIWLNEGFATYLTLLFIEKGYPSFYPDLLNQTHYFGSYDSVGSVFCKDTTDENRIFSSALSYNKGAYLLHMLRGVIGDSSFFKGVRRYVNDPNVRNGFALSRDLIRNMEAEVGYDLDWFFDEWLYGGGYPKYNAEWSQNNNGWLKIRMNQTTTHSSVSFFKMPVRIVIRGSSGEIKQVLNHQYNGQDFWIKPDFTVDTVIIDPDKWILTTVRSAKKVLANKNIDDIKIYPNPSTGPVNVSISNPTGSKLYLRLYNSLGQLIYQRDLDTPGRDELITIPSTVFARGTYMLQVRNDKEIKLVKKIVR